MLNDEAHKTGIMSLLELRTSAVVKHLQSVLRKPDLFEWLEDEAESLGSLGATKQGPIQFTRELRHACRVKAVTAGAVNARAELRSDGAGYFVTFNAKYSPAARRFAIAHEFGHTVLSSPAQGTEPPLGSTVGAGDRAVEAICDYFAGAMLVPRNALRQILDRDQEFRRRPPLHLIPEVARRFDVQRRIAAWRLLLVSGLQAWLLLRVQSQVDGRPLFNGQEVGGSWTTVWYVRGDVARKRDAVKGYDVPFATHRRIPAEMIPDAQGPRTSAVCLDSRWWDGVQVQPAGRARLPMKARPKQGSLNGFSALIDGSLYLALSEEQD